MIRRVHHVGIVVASLEGAFAFWRDALGLPPVRTAELPDQGVRATLLACGSCEIELLEPTAPDTGVARFLARRGEGLHHLCFESDDVGRELRRLAALEVELLDPAPRPGLAGVIAFLHPRTLAGALIELATPPDHARLPEAPLTVRAVHVRVADVRAAARRYGELFGLAAEPPGERAGAGGARLAVGSVDIELLSTDGPSDEPGLAALRLEAVRPGPPGVASGQMLSHGVPLVIEPRAARPHRRPDTRSHGQPYTQPQTREDGA